ncbi:ABC transporter substrate-binding protein [Tessaracoccus sp. MC1756]|uniref:ABC transporter substrate-binding protein n=1 Tax=Tessaracoccus sp. MC1756 TaxID=2760311 RepID=UPI0016014706|nr:ABC transporter substrate-binding protein [Tessaracoccus sp. MC1756]MBB1510227.1 ABC transporter substrate-binding protein [Tessaracoccus sp. MC1756]
MRRSSLSVAVILALVASVVLSACARPDPAPETAESMLNIGVTTRPDGLDPITVAGAGTPFVLLYNVYETLVKVDSDGNIKPLLSKEWRISEDSLQYTFTLESGAQFASGAPVDADAVVANFERNRGDTATAQIRDKWGPVDTIEAIDESTVEITLKQPSHAWLYDLSGPMGIVADPAGFDTINTVPVGSGSYVFDTWEEGSYIQLKPNTNYWGTPGRFSDVYFRYYSDPNAMNAAMLSGQLDIISNLTVPQSIEQFRDESRYTIHEGTTTGEVVLGFNHGSEPLKDLKVRQAINHAIDREALVDAVWAGMGPLIGSHVPPTDPWYEDLSRAYPFDPAKARELLKEAGHESGLTLRLRVPVLPYAPPSARFIAEQLKAVGIDVVVEELEWGRWLEQVYGNHDYDMTIVAHVEPRDMTAFSFEGNYWAYNNPEYNELLKEADASLTPEEQTEKLKEAARLLSDDAAADWLFLLPSIIITTPDISGVQVNQISLSFDLTMLARG